MEEARRFLRHVMPGFVYGIETFAGLFLVFPEWTGLHLSGLTGKESLGVVVGAIFVSGALGYVFATMHHWLHWHVDKDILDHRPVINRLRERGLIPDEAASQLGRKEALVRSMALWYERVRENGPIEVVADKKLVSLGDSIHGLGAARVASVFALITVLGFCFTIGTLQLDAWSIFRFALMLGLTVGATYLFHKAYYNVGEIAQAIYDRILEDALAREHQTRNAA